MHTRVTLVQFQWETYIQHQLSQFHYEQIKEYNLDGLNHLSLPNSLFLNPLRQNTKTRGTFLSRNSLNLRISLSKPLKINFTMHTQHPSPIALYTHSQYKNLITLFTYNWNSKLIWPIWLVDFLDDLAIHLNSWTNSHTKLSWKTYNWIVSVGLFQRGDCILDMKLLVEHVFYEMPLHKGDHIDKPSKQKFYFVKHMQTPKMFPPSLNYVGIWVGRLLIYHS